MSGSVILTGARTPIGKLSGAFASLSAACFSVSSCSASRRRRSVRCTTLAYHQMSRLKRMMVPSA